ncbi:hypothetical protein HDU89_000490 [Geranomyces variabilis]|nr:hypothetical protein HDU89_000490 [Geranomyces variabilis]
MHALQLVINFGLTIDLWKRFRENEAHFGGLPGSKVEVITCMLTDKLDQAEDIGRNWFDVAAEPLVATGPQMLRGGSKRSVNYHERTLTEDNQSTTFAQHVRAYRNHVWKPPWRTTHSA